MITNWEQAKYLENKNYEILDQIDLMPYIKKYDNIHDLIDRLQDDYNYSILTNNDVLRGYILNHIDTYGLIDYIKEKYKVEYKEIITTSFLRDKF